MSVNPMSSGAHAPPPPRASNRIAHRAPSARLIHYQPTDNLKRAQISVNSLHTLQNNTKVNISTIRQPSTVIDLGTGN